MSRWLVGAMASAFVALSMSAPTPVGSPVPHVVVTTPQSAPAPGPPRTTPASSTRRATRFWVHDTSRYTSPWYAGSRRKMVAFGCTRAPYYDPDPRCTKHHGFHHGLDLAMPCGTPLYAAYRTRVVRRSAPGWLGSAYGDWAFRLRSGRLHRDFVIGHVRHVYVTAGEPVRRGQLIARVSNAGAPDGCHLHFEVRPRGGGYQSAVRPYPVLRLRRAE